ncbi:MFS transporter [Candidatus Symbiopectobacterium sp. NZEC127]|uniref:MFS transporter n=1 Tax=Candidatus Symbiopectobacterium sp. NZEC127 TaxID=2820472 RepID=UPI002227540F|nr:MFS transporter [Candidatus Symbiopectobacterium sp. NZEC127]MCW2488040.1 MFS transporter [Candidatus Symbiopectobacterium sp. NZEC127]
MNSQSYGYLAALLVSLLGSSLSMLALPWFLLEITNDVKYTGIILGIRLLPVSLSLFFGVKLIDQYSKKTICVLSDLFSAILVFAIPALYSVSMLNMGVLVLLICALTAVEQVNHAGLGAMVPDLLKDTTMPNERLNGIIGSLHNVGDLVGPPLAGLIIALVGSTVALILDGITFVASSCILFVFIKCIPAMSYRNKQESTLDNLKEGFLFIFCHPKIRFMVIPSVLVNFHIIPLLSLILPYLAKTSFSSAIDLGFMISAFGCGALLSSLIFTTVGERFSKSWLLIVCTLTLSVCFLLAIFAGNVYVVMVLLFFVGLSVGLMGPLDDTILQTNVPERIRGRVFLVYSSLRFATIPLAMVFFGFLLDATSIENTFACMAASLGISLIWLLANRKACEAA